MRIVLSLLVVIFSEFGDSSFGNITTYFARPSTILGCRKVC